MPPVNILCHIRHIQAFTHELMLNLASSTKLSQGDSYVDKYSFYDPPPPDPIFILMLLLSAIPPGLF